MKETDNTDKVLPNELTALHRQIAELEQHVIERTALLEEYNKKLRDEIVLRKKTEEELLANEQKLRNIIEHSNELFYSHDSNHKLTYVSPQSMQILGYSPEEMMIQWMQLSTENPINELAFEKTTKALQTGEKQKPYLLEMYRKDGSKVLLEIDESPFKDNGGRITGIVGAARDVTEHITSEEEMKKLSLAVEQSSDWVLITDKTGRIEYLNKAVEEMTGYKKEELIGKNPSIFKSGKYDKQFYKELWDTLLLGRSFQGIITNRRKNGELFEIYHTITPIKDNKGNVTHFVATSKDLTKQKLFEEKIHHLAYYDVLTGLPNRILFIDRLKQTMARAEYNKKFVAVLFIDIDRFTFINDTFGPSTGDEILKKVSERLLNSLREGDTVARLGNDEFGISLVDVASSQDIILLIEKIMEIIRQPLRVRDENIVITATIGISVYPVDGKEALTLVRNADIALSKAKATGMNNYQFYTADMNVKASEFVLLERHLFNALKNNEYVLHYQPYFDINTKEIKGMEALIRWNSPELGLVPPVRFIAILEETRMIIDVGKWTIKTVCSQIKEWQNKGYKAVPVTVNLSIVQFRQVDFGDMLERSIKESGIEPGLITFEITESIFMQDVELTRSVLERLKKLGISINIDDFGTGYSSLSYLKKLPIDNLKIDISFIREIASNPEDAAIVATIISMAHNLNLKTIAEGVETEEQWKILRILRCDMAQGYYFSMPLTTEDAGKMLSKS